MNDDDKGKANLNTLKFINIKKSALKQDSVQPSAFVPFSRAGINR